MNKLPDKQNFKKNIEWLRSFTWHPERPARVAGSRPCEIFLRCSLDSQFRTGYQTLKANIKKGRGQGKNPKLRFLRNLK